ncbi:MAG: hypothetical protein ABIK68_15735 [bacterium]
MKKDIRTYILYLFLIPWIFLPLSSCKTDNELQSALIEYEPLLRGSKYVTYNLSSSSQVRGVYTLSLSGTQAFDSNYWGWEQPAYFLSGGNMTLSAINTISSAQPPGPQDYATHSAAPAFADGTFPTARAYTGIIRPLSFATIKRTFYNSSGELAYDDNLKTYSLSYDATTDLIKEYSILTQENATDTVTLNTYGFSADPRSYSTYYASSYTKKAGANNTLVGSVTTMITADSTSDTYTYRRTNENGVLGSFDASSDLGYLDSGFFDDANSQTILKIVTAVTYYPTATVDISADSLETITEKYTSETNVVYKEVTIEHYANYRLRQLADYQKKTYNVSGSTETQLSQQKKWYTNGYLVLDHTYAAASGWTSPSSYVVYVYDAQGRVTAFEQKDASGTTTFKKVYTFNGSGQTASVRSYNVDSSGVETCNSSSNKDYSYTTQSSTSKTISEISYGCTGTSLSTTPSEKITRTYHTSGKLITYQRYSYLSIAYLLTSQTAYGYGSSGERLYIQNYSVDGTGQATATTRTEYTYDDNLFLTSTINKNASGQVSTSYYVYSYTYR